MTQYIIHRNENDGELYHFGVRGMKWGIRRYQNPDGSYKSGAEGRYAQDSSGRTLKNRVKSALGVYKDGDGNPYVSDRRRKIRKTEQESFKEAQAKEQARKQTKETKKKQQSDDEDTSGRTLKNKLKSTLGIYKDGDGNPYVSEKRREDRRRQQEEQQKQKDAESTKKAQKDIDRGKWYKTYNKATDEFNKKIEALNQKYDGKGVENKAYVKAVNKLWNDLYSDAVKKTYGNVNEDTIRSFPFYDQYLEYLKK